MDHISRGKWWKVITFDCLIRYNEIQFIIQNAIDNNLPVFDWPYRKPGIPSKCSHHLRTHRYHQLRPFNWRSLHPRLPTNRRLLSLFMAWYFVPNKGVMFMTLTSTSNYDTLIFNRATTSGSGVYSVTANDYYVSPGRPNTLMIDTMTSNDQTTTSTTDSSTFTLTFPRTTSSTNG